MAKKKKDKADIYLAIAAVCILILFGIILWISLSPLH
jgi:membrane protein involved in colicin uptake